jgi:hypothetical protein
MMKNTTFAGWVGLVSITAAIAVFTIGAGSNRAWACQHDADCPKRQECRLHTCEDAGPFEAPNEKPSEKAYEKPYEGYCPSGTLYDEGKAGCKRSTPYLL